MKILRLPSEKWDVTIFNKVNYPFYSITIKGLRSAWPACVRNKINIYAEVDESVDKISTYYFSLHETGEELPKETIERGRFVKTLFLDNGDYVVHVYEYQEDPSNG